MIKEETIEAVKTPKGGWTKKQLAEWGVPWPPPKGWKRLIQLRTYSEPFRVAAKFRCIEPHRRLLFLQKKESEDYGIRLSFAEMKEMRRCFDKNKVAHLGLSAHTMCWCCQNAIAVIRHHVQPISKGGRNKRNNIVPLCNDCHISVHPHMQRETA